MPCHAVSTVCHAATCHVYATGQHLCHAMLSLLCHALPCCATPCRPHNIGTESPGRCLPLPAPAACTDLPHPHANGLAPCHPSIVYRSSCVAGHHPVSGLRPGSRGGGLCASYEVQWARRRRHSAARRVSARCGSMLAAAAGQHSSMLAEWLRQRQPRSERSSKRCCGNIAVATALGGHVRRPERGAPPAATAVCSAPSSHACSY